MLTFEITTKNHNSYKQWFTSQVYKKTLSRNASECLVLQEAKRGIFITKKVNLFSAYTEAAIFLIVCRRRVKFLTGVNFLI